ncbi:hypothetical protein [Gordonia sp. N1V]|uniref:hypothetical protein n=1 Tax=Gordonia sp. N1V TaxID=3034163 RepID=UPI0009AEFD5B|nr:hypothetical protein [Gordonia sp. N1V]MDF3283004.1 hypothetical protein [Gordonia sp. N1V]OPX10732.1 hypothetical protein B1964_23360 [Gordonia sp. i37]
MKSRLVTMGIGGAAVLAAALTGCSSTENSSTQADSAASTSASSSASTSSSGSTGTTEMAAFEKCMANNGVTMPAHNGRPGDRTPPSGAPGQAPAGGSGGSGSTASTRQHTMSAPPGVDQATWTKALAACKSLAPTPQPQPSS